MFQLSGTAGTSIAICNQACPGVAPQRRSDLRQMDLLGLPERHSDLRIWQIVKFKSCISQLLKPRDIFTTKECAESVEISVARFHVVLAKVHSTNTKTPCKIVTDRRSHRRKDIHDYCGTVFDSGIEIRRVIQP
jgi:hypothetical protein